MLVEFIVYCVLYSIVLYIYENRSWKNYKIRDEFDIHQYNLHISFDFLLLIFEQEDSISRMLKAVDLRQ